VAGPDHYLACTDTPGGHAITSRSGPRSDTPSASNPSLTFFCANGFNKLSGRLTSDDVFASVCPERLASFLIRTDTIGYSPVIALTTNR